MPCSCFGKKDKKGGAVGEEKYRPRDTPSREQEPLSTPTPTPATDPVPAPVQAPAPVQTPVSATPPTPPVTPTSSGDARLRPEDDPDKASRRRDVVASFYSDQCELIGFKATGSRPPSTLVGGVHEGPAATSSPTGSPPAPTRSSAFSRAELAHKRREFFKELAVNDGSSSRYGTSQPSWRMLDSGSLTTPRRSHQQDNHHHHTLPFQARASGGLALRPVSTPPEGTPGLDTCTPNGDHEQGHDQRPGDSAVPEKEPLLGPGHQEEPVARHPEAGAEKPPLINIQLEGDQAPPSTVTPASTTAGYTVLEDPSNQSVLREELQCDSSSGAVTSTSVTTHVAVSEDRVDGTPKGDGSQLHVDRQQYAQQVSVQSDDERLAEGSGILIREAFPAEPHHGVETPPPDFKDIIHGYSPPRTPPAPAVQDRSPSPAGETHQGAPQHSTVPPARPSASERPSSLLEEEEEELRYSDEEAESGSDQESKPLMISPLESGSPLPPDPKGDHQQGPSSGPQLHEEPPQGTIQAAQVSAPPSGDLPPARPHSASPDHPEDTRPSVAIVGCIPKVSPTPEPALSQPSPPHTPPASHPLPPTPPTPPTLNKSLPPAPPTPPTVKEPLSPSPPTPPSLSESGVTCGVDVSSSSPLEDDGLGSDIDDALSSLECLNEEGNNDKRATAST